MQSKVTVDWRREKAVRCIMMSLIGLNVQNRDGQTCRHDRALLRPLRKRPPIGNFNVSVNDLRGAN
jgi:hypothetical protein